MSSSQRGVRGGNIQLIHLHIPPFHFGAHSWIADPQQHNNPIEKRVSAGKQSAGRFPGWKRGKRKGGEGGRGWERGRVGVATRQWKTMGLNRSEISALWHMRTASRIHPEDRTALNLRAPPAENVHAAAPSQPPFRR